MKINVEIVIPDRELCNECDWIEILENEEIKYNCMLFDYLDFDSRCKEKVISGGVIPCKECLKRRKKVIKK